jgi:hypothetical protein
MRTPVALCGVISAVLHASLFPLRTSAQCAFAVILRISNSIRNLIAVGSEAMTISVESPSRPPTHYRLPSGDMMPAIGLGCWQSPPEQLIPAVEHAIKVGYRHIDGATIYGNEDALGEGIRRSGVKREEIWVTTKLWNRRCPTHNANEDARPESQPDGLPRPTPPERRAPGVQSVSCGTRT